MIAWFLAFGAILDVILSNKVYSFGTIIAMIISWSINHSILWMILHGILSWLYVIYYAL